MRKFLVRLLLFALPGLVVFAGCEWVLRSIPNEYSVKFANFQKKKGEIEVLVLGSSHALRSVNPNLFKKRNAYNLAMFSQPLEIDHRIVMDPANRMPHLRAIVISISYFSLSKQLNDGEIFNRLPFYHFFYGLSFDELNQTDLKYYSLQATLGFRTSLSRIYRFLRTGPPKVACDSFGWMGPGGNDLPRNKLEEDAEKAVGRHEDGSFKFNTNLALLEEIALWAKNDGIEVILINTPKTRHYNRLLNEEKSSRITQSLVAIERRFSNVHYLDFQNDERFAITDFRNADHLNERGAMKFTQLLNAEIERLIGVTTTKSGT